VSPLHMGFNLCGCTVDVRPLDYFRQRHPLFDGTVISPTQVIVAEQVSQCMRDLKFAQLPSVVLQQIGIPSTYKW
jgi:hypothetical protein